MKTPSFSRLRVTLVSGISGAGKSSLMRRLVNRRGCNRSVAIVNTRDQPAAADEIFGAKSSWPSEFLAIAGGCICCDRRDEWIAEMDRLARFSPADSIFVEATGVAEPVPLAEPFLDDRFLGGIERLVLHRFVTVIDAETFLDDFESTDDLRDRGMAMEPNDDRSLSHVLTHQVECANVIAINKIDRVSPAQRRAIEALASILNPDATVLYAIRGRFPGGPTGPLPRFSRSDLPARDPRLFSLMSADRPRDEFGLSSFRYRRRRPFHPGRLVETLEGKSFRVVLRCRGLLWLATRMETAGMISMAGRVSTVEGLTTWAAATPKDDWPDLDVFPSRLAALWREPYGDRRQELCIIGQDMDHKTIEAALDRSLLTDAELARGPDYWKSFEDSWPGWDLIRPEFEPEWFDRIAP